MLYYTLSLDTISISSILALDIYTSVSRIITYPMNLSCNSFDIINILYDFYK